LQVVENINPIPEIYFKHLEGTDGSYEIRAQNGSNIFRIFCFFDQDNLTVVGNGFQKITQKTQGKEIDRAEKIKYEYYAEKQKSRQP